MKLSNVKNKKKEKKKKRREPQRLQVIIECTNICLMVAPEEKSDKGQKEDLKQKKIAPNLPNLTSDIPIHIKFNTLQLE